MVVPRVNNESEAPITPTTTLKKDFDYYMGRDGIWRLIAITVGIGFFIYGIILANQNSQVSNAVIALSSSLITYGIFGTSSVSKPKSSDTVPV